MTYRWTTEVPILTEKEVRSRFVHEPEAPYEIVDFGAGRFLALNRGPSEDGKDVSYDLVARIGTRPVGSCTNRVAQADVEPLDVPGGSS